MPTRPIAQSGAVEIAGRPLDLHVAPFAATEADLWILRSTAAHERFCHPLRAAAAVVGDRSVER